MSQPQLPLGPLQRFGILGGSFNPVHVGHLSIAQQVQRALKLERVVLMPAWRNPHKSGNEEMAPADDRLEMCRLAVLNMSGLGVSDLELQRGGISYTVETARVLRTAYGPGAEIRFLIGSDSLVELSKWKEIRELLQLADFAIADRRDEPLSDALWQTIRDDLGAPAEKRLRQGVVPIERVDVSATEIRRLLKAQEKVPGYLRKDVERYIREKGLYGTKA